MSTAKSLELSKRGFTLLFQKKSVYIPFPKVNEIRHAQDTLVISTTTNQHELRYKTVKEASIEFERIKALYEAPLKDKKRDTSWYQPTPDLLTELH